MKYLDDMIKENEGIPKGTLFIVPWRLHELTKLYFYFEKEKVDNLIQKYIDDNKEQFAIIKNIKIGDEDA